MMCENLPAVTRRSGLWKIRRKAEGKNKNNKNPNQTKPKKFLQWESQMRQRFVAQDGPRGVSLAAELGEAALLRRTNGAAHVCGTDGFLLRGGK